MIAVAQMKTGGHICCFTEETSRVTSATVASGLPILAFKKLQKDLF